MTEAIQAALGFVSASLVALIAIGFGAMFLFFSGSAALVLGQFLPFMRAPGRAAAAIALAAAALGAAALLAEAEVLWLPPLAQLAAGALAWALLRAHRFHRALRLGVGGLLLASGCLFAAWGLGLESLFVPSQYAIAASVAVLSVAALGLWPLVVGGLLWHSRERPLEWFISRRYLFAKRRQTFISVITVICVLGVALGVSVITVVLSVMNGFSRTWEEKIIGARAHLVVYSHGGPFSGYTPLAARIREVPGVTGATPFLETEAVLRGGAGKIQAVLFKGIDPATVGQATRLPDEIVDGSLADLDPGPGASGDAALPGLILGAQIADRFLLRVGDPVVMISPLGGAPTPLGPAPRMERFRVAGIFHANFFQFDESFVYASIPAAQSFMKLPEDVASGIEVTTHDAYRSVSTALAIQDEVGPLFYTRDWKAFYPAFFQALKTERAMMFVLLSFIMVVAGFIIVATLIMMIMEKSRDIAILKAMGCEDDGILRIFAIQGCLIGVAGLGLGIGMGLVITWNLSGIQLIVERLLGIDVLPADVYQLQSLPFDVVPGQLGLVALIAMVLSVGATLFPSWQASRLDPAEALRYE